MVYHLGKSAQLEVLVGWIEWDVSCKMNVSYSEFRSRDENNNFMTICIIYIGKCIHMYQRDYT